MEIAWSLVFFTVLSGCGGWLLAAIAIDEFAGITENTDFKAGIVGLVLLAVGGLASATHLAHPENIFAAFNHPTSGIFLEAVLIAIAGAFAVAYLVTYGRNQVARRVCIAIAALVGVALSFMAGNSYIMSSCSNWDTMLLPLAYLGTTMVPGVALYCALAKAFDGGKNIKAFSALLVASGAIAAITAILYVMHVGDVPGVAALGYGGAVVIGGVVPFALGVVMAAKPEIGVWAPAAACACGIVGAICIRVCMWMAFQPVESFFGLLS
ncbi:dimethyl sulfoxide reductase anchor subunit family protein [Adlercreutzia caecimuris]|uniref:dimethyl sulfoxide reductase anchor subunit family protein n=1 Tax=Adlercreutzia caecimuris TaxID=671266 RepID=UPI00272D03D8|nr:DmsC/YnfH family molybdoenzyme membrane anchor subunit [Adlercreutzia caecimuris]